MSFKLEYLSIGVALFALVFLLGSGFITELTSNYGVEQEFVKSKFDNMPQYTMDGLYNSSQDMESNLKGETVTSDTAIDNMYSGAYKAVRVNPYTLAGFGGQNFEQFAKEANLFDSPVIKFVQYVLVILTVAAILYLIFRVSRG